MGEEIPEGTFDASRYWEERLTTRYTLGSTGWLGLGEGFNRWMYALRSRTITRFIRSLIRGPAPCRVLDVGSGTGFYLDLWRRVGVRDITSCDLTSVAVERLRATFPEVTVVQADVGGEPEQLPQGGFDAISVIDVLYHVMHDDRYQRAFENLAALLTPDGTLFFTENLAVDGSRGGHQVHRTRETIERVVANAGLAIVDEQPLFFLMNAPVSSRSRLLHRWWWLLGETVSRHEALSWTAGAILFPVELGLTHLLRHGPSTTILACRRRS